MRAMWEFFSERLEFEKWKGEEVPVEVEVEETRPAAQRPVRVSGPGEAVSGEPGGSPGDEETAEIRKVQP
jgi:hypothetical protein